MKKVKILLIALVLVLGGVLFSSAYAANVERTLGAQLARPFTNSKYQYLVPSNTIDVKYTVVKIYDDTNRVENELAYNNVLYCLRGGKGFGANVQTDGTDVSTTPISYTELAEMHLNAKEVIAKYKELYNVDLDRAVTINGTEINLYNSILWVLDESYLPKDIVKDVDGTEETVYNASEYKKELLDKAGVPTVQQVDITDDDLEVIQQLAIWYFSNYDEQSAGTKPTVSQSTMFPAQFLSINENNNISDTKANNLDRIYQYLIYGAIDNAGSYNVDSATGARSKTIEINKFDKDSVLTKVSVDIPAPGMEVGIKSYYKIGPIKIESDVNSRTAEKTVDATNIVLYDANGLPIDKNYVATNGTKSSIYEFVDSNGAVAKQLKKGVEYYIVFYKVFEKGSELSQYMGITEAEQYDVSKVKLKITSSYSLSTATFLYATENSNDNQAIVEIQKEKVSESDEITTEYYDLSLRKFITAINGNILTGTRSRVPSIYLSKLNTTDTRTNKKITTATYTHQKNALLVETGDKVVYTIRVYNEGELDGKALEITDYLPEGLQLATESQINTQYKWTNPSGDGKTIVTDYLKDTTIKAYDPTKTTEESGWQKADEGNGGLYYADVQVECEVIAQVTDTNQSLRNIAEISNDDGNDRDSVPNNVNINEYTPPSDNSEYQQDDDDYEDLLVEADSFDLALRKYIVGVENTVLNLPTRTPNISIDPLNQGETTADYNHRKDPVEVETGNIVTYRFSVYNEGDIDGYVYSIVDYLPEGLTFDIESNTNFIEYKQEYTDEELIGKEYAYKIEGNKLTILPLNTNSLFELSAFNGETLDSKSIDVKFKVTASESNDDQVLTNVATMTYGAKDANIADRDSNKTAEDDGFTIPTAEKLLEDLPGYKGNTSNKNDLTDNNYHYEGQEDDDDFEKIIIKGIPFDLSLRKFITSIKRNGEEVGFDDRTPSIDTTTLINGTFNRNGVLEHTATYNHSKEPLVVKQGDIITYTLRIYNEGERAGYATEVTDYIPEGLAFINYYNTNSNNLWLLQEEVNSSQTMNLVGKNGFYKTEEEAKNFKLDDFIGITSLEEVELVTGKVSIRTNQLNDELLKPFDKTLTEETAGEGWQKAETGEGGLYYKDIQVSCLVIAEDTYKDTITNIAEISDDKDEFGKDVIDRDSNPDNKKDPYTTSQEDDDDYEPVVLRYFDLALRKFITGVESNGKVTDITSRIPVLSVNEETGNIKYTHPKEESPVEVANNDIVIYTLRVYNEGTLAGYAEELTDDIPEGLIYLPQHDINKQYEWKMYDKDGNATDNLEDAETIKTEYLSKENESENRDNLIEPYDSSKEISTEEPLNPDYKDVKVAFRVIEPNTSDRVIVNSAQISEDSDDDDDSVPGKWNDGEDDQDKEYIYVKYFDLSLLKWVTQTIVTVDEKTTTTETGFKPNTGLTETTGIRDNKENEPVAKVEVDKNKLSKTTVKFAYKIRVTNEGEIAGYATEITDFIPEGLEFKAEDNKKYGWVKVGDNKVTTRALETVLLQPGESTELEIVFTWINNKENLGVKTNIAEITEDYNENNSQDIDSTPENKKDPYEKEQEDDDDFALVVLSIKTGKGASYIILITTVITMLAGGIYLIKKYVLTY